MKIARFARVLLCLVLVCALLVNASPIKVHATGMGGLIAGGTTLVSAPMVIGAIAIGLGIYALAESDVFDNFINNVKLRLMQAGIVNNDQIEVYETKNANGETVHAVPESVVSSVQSAAVAEGVITSVAPQLSDFLVPAGTPMTTQWWTTTFPVDVYCFTTFVRNDVCEYYVVTDIPFDSYTTVYRSLAPETHVPTFTDYNGFSLFVGYGSCVTGSTYGQYRCDDLLAASGLSLKNFSQSAVCGLISLGDPKISVSEGFGAGAVADPNVSISEGYPSWSSNSFGVSNSDEKYYPISIAPTYDETITKTQEDIWAGVSEYTSSALLNWVVLLNLVSAIKTFVGNISEGLSSWFDEVVSAVAAIPGAFSDWFDQIISGIAAIPDAISTWWQELIKKLEELWGDLASWWSSLVQTIVDALTSAFVLDEAYVMTQVQGMTSNFPFLASMVDFGRGLADVFYGIGSKPPVIYVDLSASESEVITGDKVVFLDLTWYEKYKPYGDSILSAFMYAWFGWKLLQTLPGLLNGSSGAVPNVSTFKRRDDE